MRITIPLWACAMLLAWMVAAAAQTDALVVAEDGVVGVGTVAPDESVQVVVALRAPSAKVPNRCRRNVPVRVVISDAATGDALIEEKEAMLSEASRLLTATLAPVGGDGAVVQVAIFSDSRLTRCLSTEVSAVGPRGIRRLAP